MVRLLSYRERMSVLHKILTFECNDSPRCPLFIRESILEVLGKSIRDAKVYDALTPEFVQFCADAKVDTVLEFGAGSGESTAIFMDALLQTEQAPPHIYISDLYPMISVMTATCERYPQLLTMIPDSVDMCNPPETPAHNMRMVLSAFHHFDTESVRRFLVDAQEQGVAVFIAEPFTNSLKAFFPLFLHGFTSLAWNGLFSLKSRVLKFLFTFIVPLIPMCLLWDGLISMIRMYDEDMLMDIVGLSTTYEWQYKEVSVPLGGVASIFTGKRKRSVL